jgi:hypothetical protein
MAGHSMPMREVTMTRILGSVALAAILIAVAAPSPHALAADKGSAFASRLFGAPVKQKSYACFVRVYDADHLARHPLQKVTAMTLLVEAEKVPEDASLNYSFRLGLKYRNRHGAFDSSGDCGHADSATSAHLGCGVDCDGGGLGVDLTADNKSVMVKVERIRTWRDNKPDDEASNVSLVAGADDRVFRLDRAGIETCKPLITDRKELAALRHK